MKQLTLALCAALALTACDEIKGTSTVSQTLNVVDKKGKQIAIKPGTYTMQFKLDEKDRELKIKIKKSSDAGKDVSMKLQTPSDFTMPRNNGQFALMANQIGQAWNLEGQIDTNSVDSSEQSGTESCSIPEQEYICREVCYKDEEGCEKCSNECNWETVYVPGTQDVRYYDTTTTQNINMQFMEAVNRSELAKFHHRNVSTYRNYTYQSECRRNW